MVIGVDCAREYKPRTKGIHEASAKPAVNDKADMTFARSLGEGHTDVQI